MECKGVQGIHCALNLPIWPLRSASEVRQGGAHAHRISPCLILARPAYDRSAGITANAHGYATAGKSPISLEDHADIEMHYCGRSSLPSRLDEIDVAQADGFSAMRQIVIAAVVQQALKKLPNGMNTAA